MFHENPIQVAREFNSGGDHSDEGKKIVVFALSMCSNSSL